MSTGNTRFETRRAFLFKITGWQQSAEQARPLLQAPGTLATQILKDPKNQAELHRRIEEVELGKVKLDRPRTH
ncbi:MAG: hypothetical protein LBS62_06405 [Clostridiales bacterium]|jgi:hypothetical protein|nr:hypothetical protein [Clostridiales bacterium]